MAKADNPAYDIEYNVFLDAGLIAKEAFDYAGALDYVKKGVASAPAEIKVVLYSPETIPEFLAEYITEKYNHSFTAVLSDDDLVSDRELMLRKLHHICMMWMRHRTYIERLEPIDYTGKKIFTEPYLIHWGTLNHTDYAFNYLLHPDKREEFQLLLTADDRAEYRNRYFRRHDPTPGTPENELRGEFNRRIDHVYEAHKITQDIHHNRKQHARDFSGYDDMGRVYLKYGPPYDKTPYPRGMDFITKGNNSWIYLDIDANLFFDFVEMNPGYYTLVESFEEATYGVLSLPLYAGTPSDFSKLRLELGGFYAMANFIIQNEKEHLRGISFDSKGLELLLGSVFVSEFLIPVQIEKEEFIEEFPTNIHEVFKPEKVLSMSVDYATFRGIGGRTRVEMYSGIGYKQLKYTEEPDGKLVSTVQYSAAVQDTAITTLMHDAATDMLVFEGGIAWDQAAIRQFAFESEPAWRLLTFGAKNPQSRKEARFEIEADVRSYDVDTLILSDIQLSGDIRPESERQSFVKNGLSILPYPFRTLRRSQPIFVYFEAYNLEQRPNGNTVYEIEYTASVTEPNYAMLDALKSLVTGGQQVGSVSVSHSRTGTSADAVEYIKLDIGGLMPGEVELKITVTDRISGRKTSRSITFRVI
ncbi:GWxTD domain-containing protein [candidate division KSB1 bacterium]